MTVTGPVQSMQHASEGYSEGSWNRPLDGGGRETFEGLAERVQLRRTFTQSQTAPSRRWSLRISEAKDTLMLSSRGISAANRNESCPQATAELSTPLSKV